MFTRGLKQSWALAKLIVLDGMRCHTVLGLSVLALIGVSSSLFFFQFIPRNIDQFTCDFILSIGWMAGLLFLLFHVVQTVSWGGDNRTILAILARPLSRTCYVSGYFLGLGLLLFLLDCIIALMGYWNIRIVQGEAAAYFQYFSLPWYGATWLGLFLLEMMFLAVILFFSSIMRGSFPVMLLSLCYYFICNGLPVVRDVFENVKKPQQLVVTALKWMTLFFPDFSRLDFRQFILSAENVVSVAFIAANSFYALLYILFFLYLAGAVYRKRDLV